MSAGRTVRGSHAALSTHGKDEAAIRHAWQAVRKAFPDHFQDPGLRVCLRLCLNVTFLLCQDS